VGRPRVINREKVAEVALAILDLDGVDGLSLERIATELGVRGPSLYYYYTDKAEILRAVAMRVLGDLALDREVSDWQKWMIDISMEFYSRVQDHPNAASLLIEYMPASTALRGFGHGARLLAEAGIDPTVQILLMEGTQKLVWGFTLQRAITALNASSGGETDAERWPELVAAQRANPWDDEELLEIALRMFIAGVTARHQP
jgi:AcrR family transcriptional regulator